MEEAEEGDVGPLGSGCNQAASRERHRLHRYFDVDDDNRPVRMCPIAVELRDIIHTAGLMAPNNYF